MLCSEDDVSVVSRHDDFSRLNDMELGVLIQRSDGNNGVYRVVFLCPNTSHHGNKMSLSFTSALVLDFFHSKRRKSYFSVP